MRLVSVKVCKVGMISEMDKYIQNMYTEYARVLELPQQCEKTARLSAPQGRGAHHHAWGLVTTH